MEGEPTIHASAVLIGAGALLVRGPAGSGKSRLVLRLIQAAMNGTVMFARLVADDRVHLRAANGRLLASAPEQLAGLIELRGLGIRRVPYEAIAVVSQVVDLDAEGTERLPEDAATRIVIAGVALPRLAVARGIDPYPLLLTSFMSCPRACARAGTWQHEGRATLENDATIGQNGLHSASGW